MTTAAFALTGCSAIRRSFTALGHHVGGNEPDHRQNAERDQNNVVQIAEHRDEVRNEVDRRQRVPCAHRASAFAYHGVRGSRAAR
jgi:hypothetical protein